MGLSLGSLKSQVSAVSVLFLKRLALISDVKTFLQGVAHGKPIHAPVPTWDLPLVMRSLQGPPFKQSASELSALSCRSPFLTFHQDRAVLRTVPSFLPKVVSNFHLNQEIVIPIFCPSPSKTKEVALNSLDPVSLSSFIFIESKTSANWILFILLTSPVGALQPLR